jgi:hypothetical protein
MIRLGERDSLGQKAALYHLNILSRRSPRAPGKTHKKLRISSVPGSFGTQCL